MEPGICHWMRYLAFGAMFAALTLTAIPEAFAQQWQDAYPGVRYLAETQSGPNEVRAVEVDLCASGVSLRATREDETWQTTSSFGTQVGAQVAINGDFYVWPPDTVGMAIGDGDYWSPDQQHMGFIAFGPDRAEITAPGTLVADPPGWMEQVVGGNVMVLTNGVTTNDQGDFCTTRHPRTVVGLSADGTTLYLAVVDGRSSNSIGMTCAELGDLMAYLGAHDALNLDGGGSTTMWREGQGVVNTPSDADGERPVVNHLAMHASGSGPAHSCPERDWDVDIETNFLDLDVINTDGEGEIFPDVFVGDEFQGEVLITNQSDDAIRDVWAGYWFEHPFLEGLDATIYTDHPEYDQQSWVVNDADDAPENPEAGEFGQEGHLNLYAFSPGETKRIVFDMRSEQYSIGMVDYPDLRAWIRSIEDIYGVQDGFWDEPDEVNRVEEHLRAFSELDVLSRDHWHFAAPDEEQLEGWRRCEGGADGLSIDTGAEALSAASQGEPICLRSPDWTEIDADAFGAVVVEVAGGAAPQEWSLQWSGADDGSRSFEVEEWDGDAVVFAMDEHDGWRGIVEELQIAVESDELLVGAVYLQSEGGEVSTPYADAVTDGAAMPVGDGDDTNGEDAGIPGGPGENDAGGEWNGSEGGTTNETLSTSSCASTGGTTLPLWLLVLLVAVGSVRVVSATHRHVAGGQSPSIPA